MGFVLLFSLASHAQAIIICIRTYVRTYVDASIYRGGYVCSYLRTYSSTDAGIDVWVQMHLFIDAGVYS